MDLSERRGTGAARHPWETARARAIEVLVRGLGIDRPCVLDIGCGDGYLVRRLHERLRFARVVAQDIQLDDGLIRELSCAEIEFVRSLEGLEYRAELIFMLDVLEHVEQPTVLLRRVASARLAAGGRILVTVPAFQWLFSRRDRRLRHFRRYSRRQLIEQVQSAGLIVQDSGYLFASLVLPRALIALLERLALASAASERGAGDWKRGKRLTRALQQLLFLDCQFCLAAHRRGVTVPGLTIWLTCKKP